MRSDQAVRNKVAMELARKLYRAMPGAPTVPSDDYGTRMWEVVDGNDHFHFCQCIATAIIAASTAIYVDPD